jgi:biopolymer transport protein ExbB/TolQ
MKRRLLISGIVIGSLLTLGPLWGLLGTALGMTRAFDILGSSGVSDPQQLSNAVGTTLVSTMAGAIACPIGILLLTVCIPLLVLLKKTQPPSVPSSVGESRA